MAEKISVTEAELSRQKEFSEKAFAVINAKYNHKPLAYVHTYGCQQNVSDSERMKGMLEEMGFGFTENIDESDLVLFNTCAVREHAENRVFGNVGALKKHKK